jgi:hypothetical protein
LLRCLIRRRALGLAVLVLARSQGASLSLLELKVTGDRILMVIILLSEIFVYF